MSCCTEGKCCKKDDDDKSLLEKIKDRFFKIQDGLLTGIGLTIGGFLAKKLLDRVIKP